MSLRPYKVFQSGNLVMLCSIILNKCIHFLFMPQNIISTENHSKSNHNYLVCSKSIWIVWTSFKVWKLYLSEIYDNRYPTWYKNGGNGMVAQYIYIILRYMPSWRLGLLKIRFACPLNCHVWFPVNQPIVHDLHLQDLSSVHWPLIIVHTTEGTKALVPRK